MESSKNKILLVVILLGMIPLTSAYSAQQNETSLGRLFTSKTERAVLDNHRRKDLLQDHVDKASSTPLSKENEKETAAVVFNGVLKRSNGKKVIWINGKRVTDSKGPDNVKIYRGPDRKNRVVVGVPGKRAVKIGPGQQLSLPDGKVAENYAAGNDTKTK